MRRRTLLAAALVWLMRDTPPGGRDSDDGAVV